MPAKALRFEHYGIVTDPDGAASLGGASSEGDGSPASRFAHLLPPGGAVPPLFGTLRAGRDAGELLYIRPVPPGLPPEIRAAYYRAARLATQVRRIGLLPVHTVSETEIVGEWRLALTVADLMALHPGGLPLPVVLPWLWALAEVVDFAATDGWQHLGFEPGRVLLEVMEEPFNGPQLCATQPPTAWGQCYLWLDPLAGFDDVLLAAMRPSEAGLRRRVAAFASRREYLAAFARLARLLVAGAPEAPAAGTIDPVRQELIDGALRQRLGHVSIMDWVRLFAEQGRPEPAAEPVSLRSARVTPPAAPQAAAPAATRASQPGAS